MNLNNELQLFALSETPYEDVRFDFNDWPNHKSSKFEHSPSQSPFIIWRISIMVTNLRKLRQGEHEANLISSKVTYAF